MFDADNTFAYIIWVSKWVSIFLYYFLTCTTLMCKTGKWLKVIQFCQFVFICFSFGLVLRLSTSTWFHFSTGEIRIIPSQGKYMVVPAEKLRSFMLTSLFVVVRCGSMIICLLPCISSSELWKISEKLLSRKVPETFPNGSFPTLFIKRCAYVANCKNSNIRVKKW